MASTCNAHIAKDERVILDPWKEVNTELLTMANVPQVVELCNEACAAQGLLVGLTPRGLLSQHKLYAYIQQQIIRLMNKTGVTLSSGKEFSRQLPPHFTEAPEQYFWENGAKILGWPEGLSKYVVSHWPVAQGFVMAFLFIKKRIDAVRIDLAPKVTIKSSTIREKCVSAVGDWEVAGKDLRKLHKKYETPGVRSARKWIKKIRRGTEKQVSPVERGVYRQLEAERKILVRANHSANTVGKVSSSSSSDIRLEKKKEEASCPPAQTASAPLGFLPQSSRATETTEQRSERKARERQIREETKQAFRRERRKIETPEQRAERRKLKELKKEAKRRETPEQRAERRQRKKAASKTARKAAKKAGVVYIPAAYVSTSNPPPSYKAQPTA